MFECPFPVKYVLENGYRIYKDHVICEGKYDMIFGLMIDKNGMKSKFQKRKLQVILENVKLFL